MKLRILLVISLLCFSQFAFSQKISENIESIVKNSRYPIVDDSITTDLLRMAFYRNLEINGPNDFKVSLSRIQQRLGPTSLIDTDYLGELPKGEQNTNTHYQGFINKPATPADTLPGSIYKFWVSALPALHPTTAYSGIYLPRIGVSSWTDTLTVNDMVYINVYKATSPTTYELSGKGTQKPEPEEIVAPKDTSQPDLNQTPVVKFKDTKLTYTATLTVDPHTGFVHKMVGYEEMSQLMVLREIRSTRQTKLFILVKNRRY